MQSMLARQPEANSKKTNRTQTGRAEVRRRFKFRCGKRGLTEKKYILKSVTALAASVLAT